MTSPEENVNGVEDLVGKTPDEMRRILAVVDAKIRSLHQTDEGELRVLSDDEQSAFDTLLAVRAETVKRLDEHTRVSEILRQKPKAVERALASIQHGTDDPYGDVRRMTTSEAREGALRVLDSRDASAHLDADQRAHVERQVRRDPEVARRILVTEHDDYRNAWLKLVTQPQPFLTSEEQRAVQAWQEFRAMAENTTTAGGFGVPVFIDPSIIMTAQGSGNPFLQIARQVPVNSNIWKGVSSAGVTWSFDTEASAVSDDSPVLAQPTVTVHMARGFIPFSIEVGQDYPSFAEEMASLLAEGYDELLIDKFSRGSGSGEPEGIVTKLDATAGSEVLLTTAGAIGAVDIYKVWGALPQRFRNRASWMMNVGVNSAVRQFGTANNFHASTIDLTAEYVDRLIGHRVYESPYFADVVSTTGHVNQVVVGDFSNYVIARRGGMEVELVSHLFDVTDNRPTGQRGWFAHARIGGGVANVAAFRLLNQT